MNQTTQLLLTLGAPPIDHVAFHVYTFLHGEVTER